MHLRIIKHQNSKPISQSFTVLHSSKLKSRLLCLRISQFYFSMAMGQGRDITQRWSVTLTW
ncbi:hypothetical protein BVRB_5g120530 [Beta vulgaris subsp. vulgaris]|nr:hypothetical protein BVRB_5g120530 [Beta vulgaris subsp. vulgaris]